VLREYSSGNGENTIACLKYLQSLYDASTRFIIIWDVASYHHSDEMKEFLAQVNGTDPISIFCLPQSFHA
jgi:hypothetical protein